MIAAGGVDLNRAGWTRLPYQFSDHDLGRLSSLNIHKDRGRRLPDMQMLHKTLPDDFKVELQKLGFNTIPNRAVGFVKSKDNNWSLPWHQDRIIAMPRKLDNASYKNWSRKSGVWHCEPPTHILEKIAFAYIAFDSMDELSGGLQIAEGSHRLGKIAEKDIPMSIGSTHSVLPKMKRGDVLLISALTLHRSAVTTATHIRRTLRIDFTRTEVTIP